METIIAFFGSNFWVGATIIAAMTTSLAGLVNGWLKANKIWSQVIAWIISIGLTVGAYFLNVITVANPVWLTLVATGLVVGLASNGIYDIPVIKNWLSTWFSKAQTEPQPEN